MAVAFVQSAQSANGSATSRTTAAATLTSVTTGHLLVVAASWDSGSSPTVSLSDTLGSTWTALPVADDSTNKQSNATWWTIATTGGTETATVTLSAASDYFEVVILEYSGVSGVDITTVVQNQAATTTPATGSVTTTAAGDLVVSILGTTSGQSVSGHPAGSTQRCGMTVIYAADLVQSSAGAINPAWSTASGKFNGATATFKAGTAGPTTYAAAGTVAAVTGVSGAVSRVARTLAAAGVVVAVSAGAGQLSARFAVAATAPVVSSAAGAVTVVAGAQTYPAAGAVTASSGAAGMVTALLPTSGIVAGVTSTAGDSTRVARQYGAAGVVAAQTGAAGDTTVVVGAQTYPVSGLAPATTVAAGSVTLTALAGGIVAATSAAQGSPTIHGSTPDRDITVTASPIATGWQVMGTTGYPMTTGPVNNNNGYSAGKTTLGAWAATTLVNQWTAGPIWIQE